VSHMLSRFAMLWMYIWWLLLLLLLLDAVQVCSQCPRTDHHASIHQRASGKQPVGAQGCFSL